MHGWHGSSASRRRRGRACRRERRWRWLSRSVRRTGIVPNVVGLTQAAATTAIQNAGLDAGHGDERSRARRSPAGNVISPTPAAGASVPPGSAVALVVSSGAPQPRGLVLALRVRRGLGDVGDRLVDVADERHDQAGGSRAPARSARALPFDGVDDWVTVTDTTASPLDLSTGMTIEAWVNPTQHERLGDGPDEGARRRWAKGCSRMRCMRTTARRRPRGRPVRPATSAPNPVASTTDQAVRGTDDAAAEHVDAPRDDLRRREPALLRQRRARRRRPRGTRHHRRGQRRAAHRRQRVVHRRVLPGSHRRSARLQPRALGGGDRDGHEPADRPAVRAAASSNGTPVPIEDRDRRSRYLRRKSPASRISGGQDMKRMLILAACVSLAASGTRTRAIPLVEAGRRDGQGPRRHR